MQTRIIASISAVALSAALGLTAAYAQSQDGGSPAAAPSAPTAQPSSPGGDSPGGMSERDDAPGTGSAGSPDRQSDEKIGERSKEPGSATEGSDREPGGKSAKREGRGDSDAQDRDHDRKSAGAKDEIDRKSAKTEDKDRIDRDRKSAETGDRDRMDRDRKSAESGDRERTDRDRKSGDRKSVKIDPDQKQKVRTYFSEHRPTAKRVDKSDVRVSIGIGIPAGIVLAPLPPAIVVVAADCPLQYFLWGDDVVLVDSCSREVVDIIPSIG
jgi:hypothetical protein